MRKDAIVRFLASFGSLASLVMAGSANFKIG
jgi:hypothetical protein